ncbi:hypothetical protein L195_g040903 [Trifolium pratense]|uniref:Uncharacterized protein n=1 Tax=Trifolium pratense TaxID=57577 RepID=A0A2K3M214_TRIPR|nr:hypothetical protein L195_g040903 [Trifolium pratense]
MAGDHSNHDNSNAATLQPCKPPSSKFDICRPRWRPLRQRERKSVRKKKELHRRKKEKVLLILNL